MSGEKLSAWAAEHGVHYRTALAWVLAGTFPHPIERTPGSHIRVLEEAPAAAKEARVALYTRVSLSDLARQSDRLRVFAAGRGGSEVEVVEEIGSGLNGHRKRLLRLLSDPSVQTIVVEHRDRLARFGVEYVEAVLSAQGREIVIVESGEQRADLVQDFVGVVTCGCARIYGRRAASNRARRAVAAASEAP